jgi:hypothetical protein
MILGGIFVVRRGSIHWAGVAPVIAVVLWHVAERPAVLMADSRFDG